jgi:hypothetical protein
MANNPHPDLPPNYRKQIADFMRTQRGDLGLLPHAFPKGIAKGGAEIGEPNRKLSFGGMQDVVCVRLNHGDGWPDFSVRRAYAFTHGRLDSGTGGFISGQGVLVEAGVCGANPNYRSFPEAEFQPQPQT